VAAVGMKQISALGQISMNEIEREAESNSESMFKNENMYSKLGEDIGISQMQGVDSFNQY
jgi:hypothetical protein